MTQTEYIATRQKLATIDNEVLGLIDRYLPERDATAAKGTFQIGLLLREMAIQDLEEQNFQEDGRLARILKSESFGRFLLLIVIFIIRYAIGPIMRLLGRK
jgi:hypothetical protein